MLDHAKANHAIVRILGERGVADICLCQCQSVGRAVVCRVCFHGTGIVERIDHGSVLEQDFGEAASARPCLQYALSMYLSKLAMHTTRKTIFREWNASMRIELRLRKPVPLVTESRSVVLGGNEPRDAANDGIGVLFTQQMAVHKSEF